MVVPQGETAPKLGGSLAASPFARGLQAVRKSFPKRAVERVEVTRPIECLQNGEADLAFLAAECFFVLDPGKPPRPTSGVEAIAMIDHRTAHLLAPKSQPAGEKHPFGDINTLGVGPENGASAQVARFLLDGYGWNRQTASLEAEIWGVGTSQIELFFGSFNEPIEKLKDGTVDAVVRMAKPRGTEITDALQSDHLRLHSLSLTDWQNEDRQYRYRFLQLARITRAHYPNVREPIETVSSQLVLAGPSGERNMGDGGPATALRMSPNPIPEGKKQELIEALGTTEAIDPALPVSTMAPTRMSINPAPWSSIMSALVLVMIGGFIYLVLRRGKNAV